MYKPRKTEARERFNAYQREYQRTYRQRNPEKVRKWRDTYIIKKAARLQAEAQQAAEAAPDAQEGGHAVAMSLLIEEDPVGD